MVGSGKLYSIFLLEPESGLKLLPNLLVFYMSNVNNWSIIQSVVLFWLNSYT